MKANHSENEKKKRGIEKKSCRKTSEVELLNSILLIHDCQLFLSALPPHPFLTHFHLAVSFAKCTGNEAEGISCANKISSDIQINRGKSNK
jgi:hypothetical protein